MSGAATACMVTVKEISCYKTIVKPIYQSIFLGIIVVLLKRLQQSNYQLLGVSSPMVAESFSLFHRVTYHGVHEDVGERYTSV